MVKQKFRGKETTQTKVVKNLLRYYALCSNEDIEAGKRWYPEAHEFCKGLAEQYNMPLYKVAGIVSVFSPQASWPQNRAWAEEFIRNRGRGFMGNRERTIKAKKIYNATHPEQVYDNLATTPNGARKTKAFYKNITLPGFCDTTTIDRHAIAACFQRPEKSRALNDKEGSVTPVQYDFISDCYVKAARKVNMIPHDFQAAIWLTVRRVRGLSKPEVVEGGFVPADIDDF